jgi:hypothetical protein
MDKPLKHRFKAGDGFEGKCKSGTSDRNVANHTQAGAKL